MPNNLQNSNKIYIPNPKRFLTKDEFQEYLELVKLIGNFDPNTKKWYVNEFKISRINNNELKEIIKGLSNYVGDEIYNVFGDYLKDNDNTVYVEFRGNYLIVYDDLEKYKGLLTYKIKTFDHIQGQYVETPVLLA